MIRQARVGVGVIARLCRELVLTLPMTPALVSGGPCDGTSTVPALVTVRVVRSGVGLTWADARGGGDDRDAEIDVAAQAGP